MAKYPSPSPSVWSLSTISDLDISPPKTMQRTIPEQTNEHDCTDAALAMLGIIQITTPRLSPSRVPKTVALGIIKDMIDALEELTACTGKCYEDAMHRAAVCALCDKMGEMVHRVYQKEEYMGYDGVSGDSVRKQAARLKDVLGVIGEMLKRAADGDDEDEVLALKMMEGLNGWRFVDMIV